MAITKAYDEIVDFIAHGNGPQSVIDYRLSEETKERVYELLHREKTGILTPEEKSELDHYEQLEHLMRLAKARAKRYLSSASSG
jgi:hypothetical protein